MKELKLQMVHKTRTPADFFIFISWWKNMTLCFKIQQRSDIYKAENCTQPTDISTSSDQTALFSSHQEAAGTLTTGWKQIFNRAQIWARFLKMFVAKGGGGLLYLSVSKQVHFLYLALGEGSREGRGGSDVF